MSLLGAEVVVGERVGDSIGIGVTVAVMDVTTGQGTSTGATGAVNAAGTVVATLNVALDAVDLVEVDRLTLGATSEDETAVSTTVQSSLELAAVGDARFESPADQDIVDNAEPPHAAKQDEGTRPQATEQPTSTSCKTSLPFGALRIAVASRCAPKTLPISVTLTHGRSDTPMTERS